MAVCGPWSEAVEETAVITGIFEAQKTVEWVDRALEAEHRFAEVAEGAGGVDQACPRSRAPGSPRTARGPPQYEGSLSWRVTRPLRNASEKLRPKS